MTANTEPEAQREDSMCDDNKCEMEALFRLEMGGQIFYVCDTGIRRLSDALIVVKLKFTITPKRYWV